MLSPSTTNLEAFRDLLAQGHADAALIALCEQLVRLGLPGAGIARLTPRAHWVVRAGHLEELNGKSLPLSEEVGVQATGPKLRCFGLVATPGTYLIVRGPVVPTDVLEVALEVAGTLVARRQLERKQAALMLLLERSKTVQQRLKFEVDRARTRARHDLKAPLSAFKGYVDLIGRGMAGPVSPTLERYLQRMRDAANRENTLIEEHLGRLN